MLIKFFLFIINKIVGLNQIPPESKEAIKNYSKAIIGELVKAGVKGAAEGLKDINK